MLTISWSGRRRTLYFWTMVGFPVVSVLSSPSTRSTWPRTVSMPHARGCAGVENHPGSGIKMSSLLMSLCTIMQVPHSSISQAQSHMRRRRCGRLVCSCQIYWRAWMLVTMIAWPAQPWRVSGLPASTARPPSARAFGRLPATATRFSRCAHNVLRPGPMHIETSP